MNSNRLIELCRPPKKSVWKKRIWFSWTAETYSLGKIYRDMFGLASYVPLFFTGDHGVQFESKMERHEIESIGACHITWNYYRYYYLTRLNTHKRFIRVMHPYVYWRRKNKLGKGPINNGRLVWFFSHSLPDLDLLFDKSEFLKTYNNLSARYNRVDVCLHMHDINKGLHHWLIENGINVVTAGHANHSCFVDRLYNIFNSYEFVCSNKVGSETYLAYENGNKVFCFNLNYKFSKPRQSEIDIPRDRLLKFTFNLYAESNIDNYIELKDKLISKALSLDCANSPFSRRIIFKFK
jgi:hypothetical protein